MNVNKAIFTVAFAAAFCVGCGFNGNEAAPSPKGPSGPFAVLISIDGDIPEFEGPEQMFAPEVQSQFDLLKILRKATYDLNVQEIVVRIGSPGISLARASEIVAALKQVTASGKKLSCHFDQADNVGYFIAASGCPKIMVSPSGGVSALGIAAEPLFLRQFLASFGVEADMLHIGRYKDAMEPLMRDDMSPESRESLGSLISELHRIFLEGIATGRKLDAANVQALIDGGPYDAKESLEKKLVDEIRPLSDFLETLRDKYSGGIEDEYGKPPAQQFSFSELMKMFGGAKPDTAEKKTERIAVVPVVGEILSGNGEELMGASGNVYDFALNKTLSDIARDDSVKAVVLRIDSPGGSVIASDNIWHAVRALAKKKPVVASFGDVAASGGYYIASAATEVYSIPATITGSIGVVGGKVVFSGAADKLGVHAERIQTGKNAGLESPLSKFSDSEREAVLRSMQGAYDMFVDRVVEGRGLAREKVLEVAEGRVWVGTQALSFGLVNKMGSLDDALTRARELAKVPAGTPAEIEPKPKNLMDFLNEAFSQPQASVASKVIQKLPAAKLALSISSMLLDEHVLAISPVFVQIH